MEEDGLKRAFCDIREKPHYRADAFVAGLKACGFKVLHRHLPSDKPQPGDVLVIWNRYGAAEGSADIWEKHGGKVIVAENGYLGADYQGLQYYALALHGHNGSGESPNGGPSRFASLGIPPKPWRTEGSHIVVCCQRGIGSKTMGSPPSWPQEIVKRLGRVTKRKLVVRQHPGKPANSPEVTVEMQAALVGAHACVIWSSANGVRSLIEGVPVFYDAPAWVCARGAKRGIEQIEQPLMNDVERLIALERMAWAQWTVDEIATGEPIRRLLSLDAVPA